MLSPEISLYSCLLSFNKAVLVEARSRHTRIHGECPLQPDTTIAVKLEKFCSIYANVSRHNKCN